MKRARVAPGGGFTLIEVLAALAIVAIGMSAVLGALTSSADTVAYLRDKTFAQWVALNHIANLRLSGQQPPTGNSDGDIDFAGRSWYWRQEVVNTEVPGVLRIDVSVRPAEVKADDEHGWFTTVSGIYGGALGIPQDGLPDWGSQGTNGLPSAGLPQGGVQPGTAVPPPVETGLSPGIGPVPNAPPGTQTAPLIAPQPTQGFQ